MSTTRVVTHVLKSEHSAHDREIGDVVVAVIEKGVCDMASPLRIRSGIPAIIAAQLTSILRLSMMVKVAAKIFAKHVIPLVMKIKVTTITIASLY